MEEKAQTPVLGAKHLQGYGAVQVEEDTLGHSNRQTEHNTHKSVQSFLRDESFKSGVSPLTTYRPAS